ncbi:LysE family translocator [Rasiella sp. SM2506]|uniref:LysE family translocator n=1 Tax=Rasiella sp. SM2506 TaxID=3423914 RepID=UPI003D7AEB0F
MIEIIISFSFATLLLALSPGPDNIYVLTQSLAHGSSSGIATTAGLISGCIVHTALLAFGISAIIAASPNLFFIIKCIGAGYLLYLAYKIFRAEASIAIHEDTAQKKSNWRYFKIGVFMNLVNPKVMLFFIAFFPAFLWNPTEGTALQFFILGGVFMVLSFLIFSTIALLAGSISAYLKAHKSVGLILKWLQIIVFVGIAVFIFI